MSTLSVILTTNKALEGLEQYSSNGYDLYVIDYETEKSFKYHGIKKLIEDKDLLSVYDYFWFPDYDLTPFSLNSSLLLSKISLLKNIKYSTSSILLIQFSVEKA